MIANWMENHRKSNLKSRNR